MRKTLSIVTISFLCIILFSGCDAIGAKSMSLSIVYAVTTALALMLLCFYCALVKNKNPWFLLLFSSVFIVNGGYLTLSLSTSVSEALLANRIAYLGSAYLMLSMLMIIINVCMGSCRRWITILLAVCSSIVFLVTASPGYFDIYYSSVSLEFTNGVTILNKTYGPWHKLYLFYLLTYYSAMILVIFYSCIRKKVPSLMYSLSLLAVTTANIGVWLLEQLTHIDFEFLSVSYIISELFLLCIYLLIKENANAAASFYIPVKAEVEEEEIVEETTELPVIEEADSLFQTQCEFFASQLPNLTVTERSIYDHYLEGKSSREIMEVLNIKENTLKYHNKNIYSKLGISSRKQLLELAAAMNHQFNTQKGSS